MATSRFHLEVKLMAGEMTNPMILPLMGTDEATIDEKGRLLIGKKKRERLGEGFVIGHGDTGCLVAYPKPVWDKMILEIMSNPSTNQGRQMFSRLIVGAADDELKFDRQGRVVVPQKLRDLAKLENKVVLVGCLDRLEIWDKSEWESYNADPENYGKDRREAVRAAYLQMTGRSD